LHEQQVQLRELAAERIPLPQTDLDPHEAGHPEEAKPNTELYLEPLAVKQRVLSDQLTLLVEQLGSAGVSEGVRDPVALKDATKDAQEHMQFALRDLEQEQAQSIRASQAGVQHGLEDILAQLKNHDWAAKVGLLTILALVLWKTFAPSRLKLLPAPLLAVAIATAVTVLLQLPVLYVEVPDNLWSEVHFPSLTVLQSVSLGVVLQAGIVLALVASAETLLCATAVDQMQSETRTGYDRELAAQGVGNIVCGLLGALPMTGVIVRSSANVDAGAKTRLSTILHGLWLLVFVSVLAFVLRMIPTAALAAMLVYIGYKLVNFKVVRNLKKYGWGEVVIYFATLGMIVCTDLLTGVLTGIGLSAVKLLYTFSHLDAKLQLDEAQQKAILSLRGAATFVRLPTLASELERVPDNVELHVDFEHLDYIDHACLDLLMNWAKQHEGKGGTLVIDWESLHTTLSNRPLHNQQIRREKAA
jgi:MFS superfamily sulfate permease-like transporter